MWWWIGLAALLALLSAGALLLPIGEWVEAFQHWMLSLGLWGVALFALFFIAATLVLLPDFPLAVAAGLVYGAWGFPVVLGAATIAASLAFLTARYFARDRVQAVLGRRRVFTAVDKAVAEEGWKVVLLLRLSPLVPFNVQNYLFGVTAVPFPHFVAATVSGIIPGTALFVYLGVLGNAAEHSGTPLKWIFFGIGLLATGIVALLVARKARAKLKEAGVGGEP